MKILVTGSNGQLGSEIRRLEQDYAGYSFTFTDIAELDITSHNDLFHFFSARSFDCVINCAAYTAVDKAEDEKELAMLVNATAAGYLAEFSRQMGALMVHLSTDYVFDGMKNHPYNETDTTNPLSHYGFTKLRGEEQVMRHSLKSMIIRTSWLYSGYGNNFVKTILKRGRSGEQLRVVSDQIGCPTYARDLAKCILDILPFCKQEGHAIYHYTNEGVASWYDFALEILKIAGISCPVIPVCTADYPSKTRRPFYSVLSKNKIKKAFHLTIPYWKDSLKDCINDLLLNPKTVP
ncbi:MAG: dTDP-4-dehydrorhamnose reductase [Bacteroidetes bacterium]|nr:dTDP-4-dehydrorhamnose reductase [Bacteroidota bacterium]